MASNLNRRPVNGGSSSISNGILNGGSNRSYTQLPNGGGGDGGGPSRGVRFEADEDARHPLADIGESVLDWTADTFMHW